MKSEPGYVGCQVFAEPRYPPSIDRGQETGEPRTPRLVGNEMLAWCNSPPYIRRLVVSLRGEQLCILNLQQN
jgi:hypothetical protein